MSPHIHLHRNPIPLRFLLSTSILSFPSHRSGLRNYALKTRSTVGGGIKSSGHDAFANSDMLRKPVVSPAVGQSTKDSSGISDEDDEGHDHGSRGEGEGWDDWEDQILEDTVPLVGFVRMILHSGNGVYYCRYKNGDCLSPQHEKTILERLLPYHPE